MIEFRYQDEDLSVVVKTEAVTLTDVTECFENFMRAVGYVVPYEDDDNT